jgi:hypothetical protein
MVLFYPTSNAAILSSAEDYNDGDDKYKLAPKGEGETTMYPSIY